MCQGSQLPPASESDSGLSTLTGGHKVVKTFREDGVNRTRNSGGGGRGGKGECLHGVWSECHEGPEPLLLSSQPLEEETKMNAEVSSLKVPAEGMFFLQCSSLLLHRVSSVLTELSETLAQT